MKTETVYKRFSPCGTRRPKHEFCTGAYYDEARDTRYVCNCEHHLYHDVLSAQRDFFRSDEPQENRRDDEPIEDWPQAEEQPPQLRLFS